MKTSVIEGHVAPSPTVAAAPAAVPAPTPAGKGHEGHAQTGAQPALSSDMAHEMGHSGKDLPAMVRDMRNRFWICLIFTVRSLALSMSGSTLVVAINALMLKRTKLAGIGQAGKNASPGAPGGPATSEPAKMSAVPADLQPNKQAAA